LELRLAVAREKQSKSNKMGKTDMRGSDCLKNESLFPPIAERTDNNSKERKKDGWQRQETFYSQTLLRVFKKKKKISFPTSPHYSFPLILLRVSIGF
jgi:hypothetical protein